MVGTQLVSKLKSEIKHYLGIPYFINRPPVRSPLKALVGKGNWQEIRDITRALAQKNNFDFKSADPKKIYNFQKKNRIGLDCSGLAYHLSDWIYQQLTGQSLDAILIGTENKTGVRRLNANLLTSPINSTHITDYDQIQTGDLIRMDKGRHVIFIINKSGKTINYVHSSDRTTNRGVHYGKITISNPSLTLDHQTWSDTTISGKPYSELFYPASGDGIFRLNCFQQN